MQILPYCPWGSERCWEGRVCYIDIGRQIQTQSCVCSVPRGSVLNPAPLFSFLPGRAPVLTRSPRNWMLYPTGRSVMKVCHLGPAFCTERHSHPVREHWQIHVHFCGLISHPRSVLGPVTDGLVQPLFLLRQFSTTTSLSVGASLPIHMRSVNSLSCSVTQ